MSVLNPPSDAELVEHLCDFLHLLSCWQRGSLQEAAEAQRRLQQHGIDIQIPPRRRRTRREVQHAS